jgi:Resolvase, N terminal domain
MDPDNPIARLMINILIAFAEYERKLISVRTKEGLHAIRDRGGKYCRWAEYGWRWEKRHDPPVGQARQRQTPERAGAGDPAQGGRAEGRGPQPRPDPATPQLPDEASHPHGRRVDHEPDRLPAPPGAPAPGRGRLRRSRRNRPVGGRGGAVRIAVGMAGGQIPTASYDLVSTMVTRSPRLWLPEA